MIMAKVINIVFRPWVNVFLFVLVGKSFQTTSADVTVFNENASYTSPINEARRVITSLSSGRLMQESLTFQALQKTLFETNYMALAQNLLSSEFFQKYDAPKGEYSAGLNQKSKLTNFVDGKSGFGANRSVATIEPLSLQSSRETSDHDETQLFTSALHENVEVLEPEISVNPTCLNHTAELLGALIERQSWALQMIDADAKLSPNLKGFQFFWMGDYEECLDVASNFTTSSSENTALPQFKGRYCTALVPLLPTDVHPLIPAVPPSGVRVGLCVPDSCSGLDITLLLNGVLQTRNISLQVALTTCQERTLDYDAKAIVALVICSIFLLLLLTGTLFDLIFIQWQPQWKATKQPGLDALKVSSANGHRSGIGTHPTAVNIREDNSESTPLIQKAASPDRTQHKERSIGKLGRMLLAFSVYSNGKKILTASHSPGSIPCIHGVRFLSMTWVILGHTFVYSLTTAANYATYLKGSLGLWSFQAITGAPVTVDTFFVLSGLLVTYLILQEMERREGKVRWFLFYFHRFWRLTPPYALVMMIHIPLFRYLAEGPNWPQDGMEFDYCKDTWWTNLLYVNNFVKPERMCLAWSWYLSNDMQFYVLSPLLFLPLFFWRRLGVLLALGWLLASSIAAGVIARVHNFPPSLGVGNSQASVSVDYFADFYIKPYCRFGPYVVGMLTGYALYVTKRKVHLHWAVSGAGWVVSSAVALSVLYGLHGAANGEPLSADAAAFYNAMHHTAWGACVCWVIFACATGHGGPVNKLLSWPAFIPLSRLTYMAYLVHPIIMCVYHFSSPALFYMSNLNCTMAFLAFAVASYAVAFILSLAFEAPMMGLEKVVLTKEQSRT